MTTTEDKKIPKHADPTTNEHLIDNPIQQAKWPKAKLVLNNGAVFEGRNFGAKKSMAGEVVFATGMVGYPEALTDPSYQGQILVLTYPMIGNYGCPDPNVKDKFGLTKYFESEGGKIYVSGLIISEYCEDPNHWQFYQTLSDWLAANDVPGLFMVDTRTIVTNLREKGSLPGKLIYENQDNIDFVNIFERHLVAEVSTKERRVFGHGDMTILCIDCGIKYNTIRCFLKYNVTFVLVPYNWDITNEDYDGLFISNGPGDPERNVEAVASVRQALKQDKPIFGICMGNQILSLAAGAKTYKLKFGHRGQNQPCMDTRTKKVVITTQNHGFAVDHTMLPLDWEASFINTNDQTNEGIRHKTKPFFSVQFHPEAKCGPLDTEYLFKEFLDNVSKYRVQKYVSTPVKKVLVLGAGGITIAQAGEFDYSGSQCLKSLREEGIETVLINPNIATVQTEPGMADHIYYVPVTWDQVERVIAKERPDGILLGWGGQTGLNCGLELEKRGILKKYNVRVLGTPVSVINVTEDRELFRDALLEIDEHVAPSEAVTTLEEAVKAAVRIGYPVMIRAAFTLGGQGSGIVKNEQQLRETVMVALASSPQVLIEKSVAGWKEVEYEVVRDIYDNTVTVCNMENFDPMGIHTGESMVVAPSQTLSNDEYHLLRSAAVKIIRHLGVVGECNIQYGLNPKSHEYVVIEVNARLSRSSALASKATGYPLAHVAVKLALGKALPDVVNSVVRVTNACFEPSLDYIVMKIPRWDLGKFNMVSNRIGSMMKSVGEVMAIGRSFEEVVQKALRMRDTSDMGFEPLNTEETIEELEDQLVNATPRRIWVIAELLKRGVTPAHIHDLCKVDTWFLTKLQKITYLQKHIERHIKSANDISKDLMLALKQSGFSDKQIALRCINKQTEDDIRARRVNDFKLLPSVKQIDTLAGEYPAQANYLYLTYNAYQDDIEFGEPAIMILGCGVYRIGNSVEFDYSGVLVARHLRALGHKVVMLNYNPETVSTDYDECSRLYFDEISHESVLDVLEKERALSGVILSVGGQIAQNLAVDLKAKKVKIYGTDAANIDRAEDRNKFSRLCDELKVDQPEWTSVTSSDDAHKFAHKVGFPVLVRPSYVLSGSAMAVIWSDQDIDRYILSATKVSGKHPVVISKFHTNAIEYDVDLVAHHGKILCYSICEHVENAGVHSGDATMFLPPQNTSKEVMAQLYDQAEKIAKALDIVGPMNVQFLLTSDNKLKIIEANVRSARSVPFVSKVLGISFPAAMVEAFLAGPNDSLVAAKQDLLSMKYVGCKASMFSFIRLAAADPILGVEMASTGEVGVLGRNKHEALLKAMLCQNFKFPRKDVLVDINAEADAVEIAPYLKKLAAKLQIFATPKTAEFLKKAGYDKLDVLYLPEENKEPNCRTYFNEKRISLCIQLRDKTKDFLLRRMKQSEAPQDYWVRRLATDFAASLITEITIAKMFCEAFAIWTPENVEICPHEDYVPMREK